MTMKEQVLAQAVLLAGQLERQQLEMLEVLCGAAVGSLTARLRDGLSPEDCGTDFLTAASLYALAALNGLGDPSRLEQVTAGDLTLKRSNTMDAASECLRGQAERLMAPYLKDRFSFRGV